jgi:hypothetical protein
LLRDLVKRLLTLTVPGRRTLTLKSYALGMSRRGLLMPHWPVLRCKLRVSWRTLPWRPWLPVASESVRALHGNGADSLRAGSHWLSWTGKNGILGIGGFWATSILLL